MAYIAVDKRDIKINIDYFPTKKSIVWGIIRSTSHNTLVCREMIKHFTSSRLAYIELDQDVYILHNSVNRF